MTRINLLPWREERRVRQQRNFYIMIGMAVIFAGLGVLLAHLYVATLIEHQEARNNFLKKEITRLKRVEKEIREMERSEASLRARLGAIQDLQRTRPDIVRALDELVRRAWGRAGRILAEYPHLETILNDPERLVIDIREQIETYRDPSKPCVVVSAHQSNWEIAASALAKLGIPNASLYSPPTNPYLDRMLHTSRQALNCELLPRDNSARLLVRALKQGRSVGIVMDRRVDDGKPIPFFGRDKPSTIMPAWLALKYGCDLVPLKVERLRDARYRATLYPPVRPADPDADPTQQAIDMTRQLHGQFEQWIRENPQDWFCSKRLWPKGKMAGSEQPEEAPEGEKHAA